MLCDPEHVAYRAYGVGQWQIERILPDAAPELSSHSHDIGVKFQNERRELGLPLVDDPWRAIKEFVIGSNGHVRLTYAYQHCEDYPNPKSARGGGSAQLTIGRLHAVRAIEENRSGG